MKPAGYPIGALALLLLVGGAFVHWLLIPALLALAVTVLLCLYRPPEECLGVLYRCGRLRRFIDPDSWCLLIPIVDRLGPPISLQQRPTQISLHDLLTADRVPIDVEFTVIYRRDLRAAARTSRYQALSWPEEAWGSIIRTFLTEAAVTAAGGMTHEEMLSPEGREQLRRRVNELLAPRARLLGIVVGPEHGVSITALKATPPVWDARVAQKAADIQGDALARRLRPVIEEAVRQRPGVAHDAYLLHLAAALCQEGKAPQIVLTPNDESGPAGPGHPPLGAGRPPGPLPGSRPDRGVDESKVTILRTR